MLCRRHPLIFGNPKSSTTEEIIGPLQEGPLTLRRPKPKKKKKKKRRKGAKEPPTFQYY